MKKTIPLVQPTDRKKDCRNNWAGTIVCRNKKTGKLRKVPNVWVCGCEFLPRQIPNDFAKQCIVNKDVQNQLIQAYTR